MAKASSTRIIKNTRIANDKLASVLVRLMQIVNDMAVLNETIKDWHETTEERKKPRKDAARALFARMLMSYVREACLVIDEIRKNPALKAEVDKCDAKTRECFDAACKFVDSEDFKKLVIMRNNAGFHYSEKLSERVVKEIAEKFPEDSSSMSLGEDLLEWHFVLGDKVFDRMVVRHIFVVPESADVKEEAAKIEGRILDAAQKIAEFAGYFVWEKTAK